MFNYFLCTKSRVSDFATHLCLITDICLGYLRVGEGRILGNSREERFQTDNISGGGG